MKKIEWGFDLTDFGYASTFENILKKNNLLSGYKRIKENNYYVYSWRKSNLIIRTGNNPLTGEYSSPKMRPNEKGYASYIGIRGEESAVKKLVADIKRNAVSIKGESRYSSDFI